MATSEFWFDLAEHFVSAKQTSSWDMKRSFEALARRGAGALDPPPTGDFLAAWIAAVRRGKEDIIGPRITFSLCDASADFCYLMARRALEGETGRSSDVKAQEEPATEAPQVADDAQPTTSRLDALDESSAQDPVAFERAGELNSFKAKGRRLHIKITDKMVAKAANDKWNDRTMVTWWKRNDKRCKPPHDRLIRAVLLRDPSSIWPRA
jgi:hypothetical protein